MLGRVGALARILNLRKRSDGSICVVFSKIQNVGQSTPLSINMTAFLKRKSDKDFKKGIPICSNPFYNSQLLKV